MVKIPVLLFLVLISFLVTYFSMPKWIRKCKDCALDWEDMNKFARPKNVAASGGTIVIMAFVLTSFLYVAFRTFILNEADGINLQIFALLTVVLILAIVGLTDDLLGWHRGGLSSRVRFLLAMLSAVPLMVINAGQRIMEVPFFGSVNFGIIYPLILIPLGITATTTVYNFLAGFNGLESGQGIIVLGFLSYVAYVTGSPWLAVIGLCMVASLLAFWIFNKVPAKVFPGDVLTYSVGALIGGMAILGNFEKIALIVFIPYIIEMILKSRGKLKKQSFGIPNKDGSLEMPYEKIYGLTHFSIWFLKKFKSKVYESNVVAFIHLIQLLFILIAFTMM